MPQFCLCVVEVDLDLPLVLAKPVKTSCLSRGTSGSGHTPLPLQPGQTIAWAAPVSPLSTAAR